MTCYSYYTFHKVEVEGLGYTKILFKGFVQTSKGQIAYNPEYHGHYNESFTKQTFNWHRMCSPKLCTQYDCQAIFKSLPV